MRTYRLETLGCKSNLYDSRRLAESLEALGFEEAGPQGEPDVCLVNTCTVTVGAERKSRRQASRLARDYPDARVYVTGCGASAFPDDLREVPGVDGVFGRDEWEELLEAINQVPLPPEAVPAGDFGIASFGGRTRAFLKVQEGCDAGCAYCILPRVRGEPRSRAADDAAAEGRRLVDAGFREIVLTGIHLGFYGRGQDGATLPGLVRRLADIPGLLRLRLSSIEPLEVDEDLLDAMRHPAVCPHLHLPLQSGDAGVLRRMGRPYTPGEFLEVVEMARSFLDGPAITTDVMVGFPGETDAAFEATMQFVERVAFTRLHVFPFSPRPGTPAADMDDRPGSKLVKKRSRRLRKLGRQLAAEWATSFVGQEVRVLFERCEDGELVGYTDRYVRLSAEGSAEMVNRLVRVWCTDACGRQLRGKVTRETDAR